jgi:hypothetical protein
MLPPNLTRHYYEARRERAATVEGWQMAPWYRLTAQQRTELEEQMEVFRRAIRLAEYEQDQIVGLNTALRSDTPASEDVPGPEKTATVSESCDCTGCTIRAAFTKLLNEVYEPLGMTVEPTSSPLGPFEVNVVPLDTRRWGVPLTQEELDRLAAATEDAFGKLTLITAGIDYAVLTSPGKIPSTFQAAVPTAKDERLRERAQAALRQWEADNRPLNVIIPPKPGKVTLGFDFGSPVDQSTIAMIRHEERQRLLFRDQVRLPYPKVL